MKKIGWIILGGVVVLALLLGGLWLGYRGAYGCGSWGMMRGYWGFPMMGGYGSSPMMGFAGGLGMLLVGVLVIGGIVWLIAAVSRNQPQASRPAGEQPLDILKRRYAAGEISKEQFDEMKRQLEQ